MVFNKMWHQVLIGSVASGTAQTISDEYSTTLVNTSSAVKDFVSKGADVVTNAITDSTFIKSTDIAGGLPLLIYSIMWKTLL